MWCCAKCGMMVFYTLAGSTRAENCDEKSVQRRKTQARQRPGQRATDYSGRSHYVMTTQWNAEIFRSSFMRCDQAVYNPCLIVAAWKAYILCKLQFLFECLTMCDFNTRLFCLRRAKCGFIHSVLHWLQPAVAWKVFWRSGRTEKIAPLRGFIQPLVRTVWLADRRPFYCLTQEQSLVQPQQNRNACYVTSLRWSSRFFRGSQVFHCLDLSRLPRRRPNEKLLVLLGKIFLLHTVWFVTKFNVWSKF